ncbi:MAG: 1-acyl-sn-glycerol-3-phosphate acyltransferase [Bacteroidota bacterium]
MFFLFQFLCRIWCRLQGWTYGLSVPPDVKKGIIIVAPHTSNWDFIYVMGGYHKINFRLRVFAKKTLFWWPLSIVMNRIGAIAVDRVKKENWVDTTAQLFGKENFFLALAPEGTRSYAEYWRTGFYHIALAAKVPVLMATIDYKVKSAVIGPAYDLTGDMEKDFEVFRDYFKNSNPKVTVNFNPEFSPRPRSKTTSK